MIDQAFSGSKNLRIWMSPTSWVNPSQGFKRWSRTWKNLKIRIKLAIYPMCPIHLHRVQLYQFIKSYLSLISEEMQSVSRILLSLKGNQWKKINPIKSMNFERKISWKRESMKKIFQRGARWLRENTFKRITLFETKTNWNKIQNHRKQSTLLKQRHQKAHHSMVSNWFVRNWISTRQKKRIQKPRQKIKVSMIISIGNNRMSPMTCQLEILVSKQTNIAINRF